LSSAQRRLHRTRSYLVSVLTPRAPIVDWLTELDATLERAVGSLTGHPLVLDLSAVRLSPNAIMHLIGNLEERKIRILGIEGVEPTEAHTGLPPVLRRGNVRITKPPKLESPTREQSTSSLLVDNPVRSGQRVFAEGDVTVVGSVGSGAEIVAVGSVHIYGTLRGRAMAGAWGNTRARIFCQRVDAELLAIGSYFKTADEIEENLRYGPAQVWLEGTTLRISAME
jgi:septum site-determining protein MinC